MSKRPEAGGVKESIATYTDIDSLVQKFKEYSPNREVGRIRKAYKFAEEKHAGQKRESGDPYFSHPVAVAKLLIDHEYDESSIVTALLHDTIEDCEDVSSELIKKEFGDEIAMLVQSVTNVSKKTKIPGFKLWLEKRKFPTAPVSGDFQNIVKLLYDSAKDGRAVAVKLADRVHNMATIRACNTEKRERVALETMTVYAPLARSLGMQYWCSQLEDLAFRILYPEERGKIRRLYAKERGKRSNRSDSYKVATRIAKELKKLLESHHFDFIVQDRVKEYYSAYRKMEAQKITEDYHNYLFDVYGYRVIINSKAHLAGDGKEQRCRREEALGEVYRALCVVHAKWRAVPGRFKDYISSPKINGYQSIHTTVAIENLGNAEIQIRTDEMHREAEYGSAAHWTYRQRLSPNSDVRTISKRWLEDIGREIIEDVKKSEEHLTKQIADTIVCFNEKGRTVSLPKGSTALDFAYLNDPEASDYASSARIDKEDKSLGTVLKHGQLVSIKTSNKRRMVTDKWLSMVNSEDTKEMILRDLGMQKLAATFGKEYKPTPTLLDNAAKRLEFSCSQNMLISLGKSIVKETAKNNDATKPFGDDAMGKPFRYLTAQEVLKEAFPEEYKRRKMKLQNTKVAENVTLDGGEHPEIARCCMPIPGEMVVGLQINGGGGSLHAVDCTELGKELSDSVKWIDVSWEGKTFAFLAGFIVKVKNSVGALGKICEAVGKQSTNISDVIFLTRDYSFFDIFFEVQVIDRWHLANIMDAVASEDHVISVVRCRNIDTIKGKHRLECSSDPHHAMH